MDENKISDNSPLGKALLGHGKGAVVDVFSTRGHKLVYEILDVFVK